MLLLPQLTVERARCLVIKLGSASNPNTLKVVWHTQMKTNAKSAKKITSSILINVTLLGKQEAMLLFQDAFLLIVKTNALIAQMVKIPLLRIQKN